MRRWLVALHEVEKLSGAPVEEREKDTEQHLPSEEPKGSPRKQSLVSNLIFLFAYSRLLFIEQAFFILL